MGLRSFLGGLWRRKMTPDEWWREFGGWTRSATGIAVTQHTAMQASAIMACVSIRAEDVAKLPLHVYRPLANGGREIATEHWAEKLLQRPNGWQTRFEFVEQIQAGLLLRGNGYAAIIRDGRGRVVALVPCNPDLVSLFEAPSGEVFYQVARSGPHLAAHLKSLPLMIPAEDMLHLRWLTFNGLVGLSRIGLARDTIGLSLAQQEHASRLFGNGARPGGVLRTDKKLSQDVIDRLKAQWQENYGGLANAGRTAVLEEGLQWEALGMTNTDAQFLESRRFSVEEIARLYRMPGHKIGITDRGTNASMSQADQDYVNNVVSSDLERWEAKLNDALGLAADGVFAEFDISRFLRADIGTRYNAYRVGIVGMFLKPNEVRRAEGLPDDPDGDKLYQPTNVAPLGWEPPAKAATGPGSDVTGAPAPGGDGDPAAVPDESAQS
jgi:HK97 family phage portal protein